MNDYKPVEQWIYETPDYDKNWKKLIDEDQKAKAEGKLLGRYL